MARQHPGLLTHYSVRIKTSFPAYFTTKEASSHVHWPTGQVSVVEELPLVHVAPGDSLSQLRDKICAATGLLPEVRPAIKLVDETPLVPVGDDDDSALQKLNVRVRGHTSGDSGTGFTDSYTAAMSDTNVMVVQKEDSSIFIM